MCKPWNTATWTVLCVLAAMLMGCSALKPQVFSERLRADGVHANDGRPATLEEIYADTLQVQRRYVGAVEEQANGVSQLSAGLIGLSAAALFKTVTGPNTTDMAAVGAIGGAGYAYGNMVISRPRWGVYRAGADALMCALNAAEPFRKGQATLGKAGDPDGAPTLYGQRAALRQRSAELRGLLDRHGGLNRNAVLRIAAVPRVCPSDPRPQCSAAPASATAEEAQVLTARCRSQQAAWDRRCTPEKPASEATVPPSSAVREAFEQARAEIAAAERVARHAGQVIAALEEAGPLLWDRSVKIQLKVSEEVDKTLPDLASVMGAAQGQRETALSLTGLEGFKPPPAPGAVQGAAAQQRPLTAEDQQGLAGIEAGLAALRSQRVRLDNLADDSLGAGFAKARRAMSDCAVKVSGALLRVFPSGDKLSLAAGGTLSFFVASGGNVPTASVDAGSMAPVKVEGGQFRFDFSAAGLAAGQQVTVSIRDSGSLAEHIAQISIVEAAATAGAAEPKPALAAAKGTPLSLVPAEVLALMGLTPQSGEEAFRATIDRCQASANPPLDKTGVFDGKTERAVKERSCRPQA